MDELETPIKLDMGETVLVNITNQQFAQLHCSQACIQQNQNNGLITMAVGQTHHETSPVARVHFA